MITRILVGVIFVPLLIGVILFAPFVVWTAVVAFISGMAAYEFLRAMGMTRKLVCTFVVLSAVAVPALCWIDCEVNSLNINYIFPVVAVLVCLLFAAAIFTYGNEDAVSVLHMMGCFFAGVMIPLGLTALVELRNLEHGRYLVLLTLLLAFITDSGAYFAGVFLGKRRGITKVSPNKSLEGYIGGLVTGAVFAMAFGAVVGKLAGLSVNYAALGVCGFGGAVVTELGDLAFSFIKREQGIKDFGDLLPGHGGMLDRFDSMIFCGPVVFCLVSLLPVF